MKNLPFQLTLAILTLSLSAVCRAAEIVVTTTDDELNANGDCSLREAVLASRTDTPVDACPADADNDTITLGVGTYLLSVAGGGEDLGATGDLDLGGVLTIAGTGAKTTIVDGNGIDRVFDTTNFSTVIFEDLRIQGGSVTGDGGCVRSQGSSGVIFRRTELTGCEASQKGGGISNDTSRVDLIDSVVAENLSGTSGGGIYSIDAFVQTTLNLENSTVSGNENTTGNGGGIFLEDGTAEINNSTITGNRNGPDALGGGISVLAGELTMSNSIVAGNTEGENSIFNIPDCQIILPGGLQSLGHNLIGIVAASCNFTLGTGDQIGFVANPLDPLLGALADNGGPTRTHALGSGSPAIDAGSPAIPTGLGGTCTVEDQRGVPRPLDGDLNGSLLCDIGAVEETELFTRNFKSRAKQDGFVVESSEGSDLGGRTKADKGVQAGDDAQGRQVISVVGFNTAIIPDDAQLLGGELILTLRKVRGDDPTATHGPLIVECTDGNFGAKKKLQIDDFTPFVPENADAILDRGVGNKFTAKLTEAAIAEISAAGLTQCRFGFELDDNDDSESDQLVFQPGENTAKAPKLRVNWVVP